jgi:hypothetical protein
MGQMEWNGIKILPTLRINYAVNMEVEHDAINTVHGLHRLRSRP